MEWPPRPQEKLAIDIISPLNRASQDARFALVTVDYHSKWPEVAFMSSVTSKAFIQALNTIFSREGFPGAIVPNNVPQFVSTEFENFLKALKGLTNNN